MKVISTFTPPSSVVASLRCSLAPSAQHLVVAKSDRIDVFSQQATGLHLECTVPIWGRIVALSAIRLHVRLYLPNKFDEASS
jgi:DNA damage-binding protein 1